MGMQSDVSAAYLTATGTAVASPARVKGVMLTGTGTAIFRDGGAGGTSKITFNNAGTTYALLPSAGVRFSTDVHVTLSGVAAITVFYG